MPTWFKTDYKGVRYRKHPSRKHGVQPDRYYVLTYKLRGKTKTEAVGWASDGAKPSDAHDLLSQLKRNQKTGKGPLSLAEMREIENQLRVEAKRREAAEAKRNVSFRHFFDETFLPDAEIRWKAETTRKAKEHVTNWIHPVTGKTPFKELNLGQLTRIKRDLAKAKRSPRTMEYVFRTFTMVWNMARDHGIVSQLCPTKKKSFRLPKIDNERTRFLSFQEAEALLEAVKARNHQAHDMALLSLHTGLRFSEVARLTWDRVDLEMKTLHVLNAKGDKGRLVELGKVPFGLLSNMEQGKNASLVFPNTKGQHHTQVPSAFKRAVNDIGLNDDLDDPKFRFGFHGLRHTRASWMRKAGADLYTIQRTLGHSTPTVTQRYAHIEQDELKAAAQAVDRMISSQENSGKLLYLNAKLSRN